MMPELLTQILDDPWGVGVLSAMVAVLALIAQCAAMEWLLRRRDRMNQLRPLDWRDGEGS